MHMFITPNQLRSPALFTFLIRLSCLAPQYSFQSNHIVDSIGGLIVIKVHVDRLQHLLPMFDSLNPGAQGRFAVTALIFAARSMQAYVSEIGGNFRRGAKSSELKDAEGGIVAMQHLINRGYMPGEVAEF